MLLRALPNLAAGTDEFRRWFLSRWGRENCVIHGEAIHADFGPYAHTLSIRAAWGGTEQCHSAGRTIGVDDDNFLVLNHGRVYATSIRASQPVTSFAICFRPGLAESIHGALTASLAEALAKGETLEDRQVEFAENLQTHDRTVSPILRYIKTHLLLGLDDEMWYEEQLQFLLARMQEHRDQTLRRIAELQFIRGATRREIYRRIGFATDYLHTNYAQPLCLAVLARVACLSKYHFLRLFTLVHGTTPYAYLQRKRTNAAVRLLHTTQLTVGEVASRVGFADRSTLLRRLVRGTGFTAVQVREQGQAREQERATRRKRAQAQA